MANTFPIYPFVSHKCIELLVRGTRSAVGSGLDKLLPLAGGWCSDSVLAGFPSCTGFDGQLGSEEAAGLRACGPHGEA